MTTTIPRKRDSAATQHALLDAAHELFGSRGYDDTTLRDIGERAGVDPSLIARYFGNKAALYIAVVGSEAIPYRATTIEASIDEVIDLLPARTDERGVGPITQALFSVDLDPDVRKAASDRLRRRLVDRLAGQMGDGDDPAIRLRVEVALGSVLGVLFLRAQGAFSQLETAPRE